MIFSELYGAYYNTVAAFLSAAVDRPPTIEEIRDIIAKNAFGESILNIEQAVAQERWQLLRADGTTPIRHKPTMPLTLTEKRWIKAISCDPRIKLFADFDVGLDGVEPLFTREDFCVFDKYSDGDPFEDESYINNFRIITDAVKNHSVLCIDTVNRNGDTVKKSIFPEKLEYSEKDDKFRLIGVCNGLKTTVNLAKIVGCEKSVEPIEELAPCEKRRARSQVEFELFDERNALERVLTHFAHFEKQVEKTGENTYRVTVSYDGADKTELVIRILSFGPMIKVTAPQSFVNLIKERLIKQKSCGH